MRTPIRSIATPVIFLLFAALLFGAQSLAQSAKTRIAIVGLDHDHVWGLLKDIAKEPQAELVAIADPRPELLHKAKPQVPASVRFFSDNVRMLDEAKPEAVFVTTENDHHVA